MVDECTELVVIRHSYTKKGDGRGKGSHLSREGVALARKIGDSLGPFDYVCTSSLPRTVETAIAMGFAVDETIDFACGYIAGEFEHHEQWNWSHPYTEFNKRVTDSTSQLATTAAIDCRTWLRIAQSAPANGKALIVSHGGSIEPVLVYCCPNSVSDSWGNAFSHCDGVSLALNGTQFVSAKLMRAGVVK